MNKSDDEDEEIVTYHRKLLVRLFTLGMCYSKLVVLGLAKSLYLVLDEAFAANNCDKLVQSA